LFSEDVTGFDSMIPEYVVKWLVESENPSVKYRAMVELLDKSYDDIEVQKCKNQIAESNPVKILLGKMNPEVYWLQKNPRTGEILGKGLKYGAFGTTHYCLSYLAELGLDRSHPKVARAQQRIITILSASFI